jgi:hypothetical protein
MMWRLAGLAAIIVVLSVPGGSAMGSHYIPVTGDQFTYYETVILNDGTGNYTGYTETTYVNGSVAVTATAANGTESATYQNSDSWSNNTGSHEVWTSSGRFTFSAITFHYVNGTDNQTGYSNPYVWFFMDNTLVAGDTFYLLNTETTVESTDQSYELGSTGQYVKTIATQGTGSYPRDDEYGVFTATYTWDSYFDPGTGYIVGYLYTEHDTDGSGDGFTWTDTLYVTHTTYTLTPASAPASTMGPSSISDVEIIVAVVVVLLIIVVVVWLLSRSRRDRPKQLPQHAAPGNIGYGAPPPPPFAPMGAAPPIQLTPSNQPVPQVVLRETVKVKCRYCGNLVDVTDKVCPFCGAPLA